MVWIVIHNDIVVLIFVATFPLLEHLSLFDSFFAVATLGEALFVGVGGSFDENGCESIF